MPRDLVLDFRVGGGSVPEVAHGIVRIWGTEVRPNATSLVVTTETTLKLSNGKATLANAQTSGTGPLYEWAYIIQVEPFHGRNFRFYVAIPDGTGPVNLVDLPKLNPYTGEGFYVDIEEWEALYGDLPDRVDALETSQATQDGKITTLEARPSGNATMRIDTTVGTRVFITNGVTERMISGDTGWRNTNSFLEPGWLPHLGGLTIARKDDTVFVQAYLKADSTLTTHPRASARRIFLAMAGFRPSQYAGRGSAILNSIGAGVVTSLQSPSSIEVAGFGAGGNYLVGDTVTFSISFRTTDPWPTTLPGTPA